MDQELREQKSKNGSDNEVKKARQLSEGSCFSTWKAQAEQFINYIHFILE